MSNNNNFTNSLIGGKYRVGPILGAGSFGEIYLATDETTGQILALKKVLSISFRRKMTKSSILNLLIKTKSLKSWVNT